MGISFTYDGVDFSDLLTVNDIDGRAFAPSSVVTTPKIPNKPGRHFIRKSREAREIELQVTIIGDSVEDLRKRIEDISRNLDEEDEGPIVFSDEPDRTYYGVMVADGGLEEIRMYGQGTITFYCADPFKYGPEVTGTVTDDPTILTNNGSAPTLPRFEIDVLQDTTNIDLVHEDGEYIRVGQPTAAGEESYSRTSLIFHDDATSLTGWTTADSVDNGYIDGEIVVEQGRFKCNLVGAAIEPYLWQGPSIKKSLPSAVTNYRMDCEFELQNVGNGTGMIEIYLKDANNNVVSKIGMEDVWREQDIVRGKLQLGNEGEGRFERLERADYDHGWNNFKGIMRIWSHNHTEGGERHIRPYYALVRPDGTHDWVSSDFRYVDNSGDYGQPITQVQIAMRTWAPTGQRAEMFVDDIKVYEINDPLANGVGYVANAGDQIVIDHENESILRNGENIKTEKDYGASFFELEPGENVIHQYPKGTMTTTVHYREAYK